MIVRTCNSAATLPDTLASIRRQTVAAEVVVVDSGSTDETLDIARAGADQVLTYPQHEFSYGRALNRGAASARGRYCGAVSSHTVLPREDWLEIALAHLDAGAVAACGAAEDAVHRPLTAPLHADAAYLAEHRYWGFTNTASCWDPEVWRAEPFDETLVASEDQEWSWRAVAAGGHVVADPRLLVSGSHRRQAGLRRYHARMVAEIRALEHLRPLAPYPWWTALADWARAVPLDPFVSRTRRFGRTRLLDVAARWDAGSGARRGTRPQPRVAALGQAQEHGQGQRVGRA
nr:glycosyltransferase family A protein [Kineococcus siccus]